MIPSQKAYSYIRFSTPDQLKGDSLRRQVEASRQYAKANGLDLDESLSVRDLGLSAFSGAHKTKGALKTFLMAIEAGKIEAGSYLIIESLDRLSREQVLTALSLFTSIIENGIIIVTLTDGMKYSKETVNANFAQLIVSITYMARAHEESATKSKRIGAAWKQKRKNADTRKLTARCPAWLKLNHKIQVFEPISERSEVVKRIFQLYLNGNGVYKITRRLNEEGVKPFGRSKGWRMSSIKKIIHNRAVLGEFQPHRLVSDGGTKARVPEGDVIKDYYPRIITDETFYTVQNRLSNQRGKGGRSGKVNNLFMHIGRCGECGANIHFINKGKWQYLQCDQSKSGRSCKTTPWSYSEFESAFLNECKELDISSILSARENQTTKLQTALALVDGLRGQLMEIETGINNYDKAIEKATAEVVIERFVKKMTEALTEKTGLEERLKDAEEAYNAILTETADADTQLKNIQELINKLEAAKGQDLADLRNKLRNTISGLVEKIVLYSSGMGARIPTGDFGKHQIGSINDAINHFENVGFDREIFSTKDAFESNLKSLKIDAAQYLKNNIGKENRAFIIYFKGGGFRMVKAEGDNLINIASTMEAFLAMVKEKKTMV